MPSGNTGGTSVGPGSPNTGGTSVAPISPNVAGTSISVNEMAYLQTGFGGDAPGVPTYQPSIIQAPAVGIGDTVGALTARISRLEELVRAISARL